MNEREKNNIVWIDAIQYKELVVNLPLQMCVHFNIYFTPCWLISHICCVSLKFHRLSEIYQFLTISSLLILSLIEIPRLYLAYIGNLLERVKELMAFWLLSVLIQLPIHLFRQIDGGLVILPLERIVDAFMLTFLIIEIIIGFISITTITKHQIYDYRKDK